MGASDSSGARGKRRKAKAKETGSSPSPIPTGSRVLTIAQPYCWLIFAKYKVVENRTWPTNYRGTLYIHASKKIDRAAVEECLELGYPLPENKEELITSAILGTVEVTDCIPYEELDDESQEDPLACGPYCFVLEKPTLLSAPIPAKGKLGIWRFNP